MKKLLKWFLPSEWQIKMNKERCNPYPLNYKRPIKEPLYFPFIDLRVVHQARIKFSELPFGHAFIYSPMDQVCIKLPKRSGFSYEYFDLGLCSVGFISDKCEVTSVLLKLEVS